MVGFLFGLSFHGSTARRKSDVLCAGLTRAGLLDRGGVPQFLRGQSMPDTKFGDVPVRRNGETGGHLDLESHLVGKLKRRTPFVRSLDGLGAYGRFYGIYRFCCRRAGIATDRQHNSQEAPPSHGLC